MLIDMSGNVVGHWTVLRRANNNTRGTAQWLCRCRCGAEMVVSGSALRRQRSRGCKSCGNSTHGESSPSRIAPEYRAWRCMLNRCTNANVEAFARYGGRGIAVCERWRSYENFLADMGRRPTPEHSVDRIDNDGNYEPGNCRWATRIEQARKRRNSVRVPFNGETLTIAEWAERAGLARDTIDSRLKRGWTVEAALTTPRFGKKTKDGES